MSAQSTAAGAVCPRVTGEQRKIDYRATFSPVEPPDQAFLVKEQSSASRRHGLGLAIPFCPLPHLGFRNAGQLYRFIRTLGGWFVGTPRVVRSLVDDPDPASPVHGSGVGHHIQETMSGAVVDLQMENVVAHHALPATATGNRRFAAGPR